MKSENKILIVDDAPENIQILLNSLKDEFVVTAAVNGEKALEMAKNKPLPDLIILDILMPEIDGYEVCKKLKSNKLTRDIPIIFISALSDVDAILKGFECGGVDYITKPFNILEVKTRIKTHLKLVSQRKLLEEKLSAEHTKRVKQEEAIIQNEKMAAMGEMLALITHQWRQPLNIISNITASVNIENILNKESIDKDKLTGYLYKIDDLVKYLSATITDFSNFFRTDKSKQELYLQDIVELSVNLSSEILKRDGVTLDYTKCHFENKVSIFANELVQVMLNIIKNSVDAASEKKIKNSKITITSQENENEQIIFIQDNNGGIAENLLKHIFESTFTTKPSDKGSGLGLYMSKIIVEEHCNGKIIAKNSDGGMLFTISIPRK